MSPPRKLTWIEVDPRAMKAPVPREDLDHRIVQTTLAPKTKTAAPDAFLGQQTQTVDRQTVNKKHITVTGSAAKPKVATTPGQGEATKKESAKSSAQAAPLARLGLPILPDARHLDPSRMGDKDEPRWVQSGDLPQDYMKGLKEGEQTALNTKEYVFYSYFQRIRQRLDRAWGPVLKEKLHTLYRNGRYLASDMDHTTQVLVHLNSVGEVIRVEIVEGSGTQDLDDSAVKAFNDAGPFPNPPHGILDADGTIRIRWEFILKT